MTQNSIYNNKNSLCKKEYVNVFTTLACGKEALSIIKRAILVL
jgi:hypothetical protein